MRVLFWPPRFWPQIGGVEMHAAKLLPALRARGHEFVVLTAKTAANQPDCDRYQGIPVHRLSLRQEDKDMSLDTLVSARRKVSALKGSFAPELLHISEVDISHFFHLVTAEAAPTPLLVTLHGESPLQQNHVIKQTLQAADWVIGCSHAVLARARELVPTIESRSSVIHNGLETPSLAPAPLPFDPPRLLCLGRLSPEKGFDLALSAMKILRQRFPEIRLVLVGDGPLRMQLEQQARNLGIRDHVDFLGWVDPAAVTSLINTATAVLMPSRRESLSLAALETALMGRPIVATRVGGIPELVLHERTGLLVEADNSDALANAVDLLLRHAKLAADLGQSARTRAQQLFGWQSHVDRYDELYKKMASPTARRPQIGRNS